MEVESIKKGRLHSMVVIFVYITQYLFLELPIIKESIVDIEAAGDCKNDPLMIRFSNGKAAASTIKNS